MYLSDLLKREEADRQIPIILGDGSNEISLLRLLAPRFDGTKCELVDIRLLPPMGHVRTGLASLENLAWLGNEGYRVAKALFLVDIEHVQSLEEIVDKLSEYGFIIEDQEELDEKIWLLDLRRGTWTLKLYAVLAGEEKCFMEELMKLARIIYGREMRVKEVRRRIREIVNKASLRQLTNALRVCRALKKIEKTC